MRSTPTRSRSAPLRRASPAGSARRAGGPPPARHAPSARVRASCAGASRDSVAAPARTACSWRSRARVAASVHRAWAGEGVRARDGALTRLFLESVQTSYAQRAGAPGNKTGAFNVLQRASSDVRIHPHLHALVLAGVYREAGQLARVARDGSPAAAPGGRSARACGPADGAVPPAPGHARGRTWEVERRRCRCRGPARGVRCLGPDAARGPLMASGPPSPCASCNPGGPCRSSRGP